jgi:hypothetical protein
MQIDEDASGYDTDFVGGGSADDSEGESEKDEGVDSDEMGPSRGKKSRAKASQGKAPTKQSPSKLSGQAIAPKKAVTPKKAAASKKDKSVTPKKSATGKAATAGKSATPRKAAIPKKTTSKTTTPKKTVSPKNVTPAKRATPRRVAKAVEKKGKQATGIDKTQNEKQIPSRPRAKPRRANPTPAGPSNDAAETTPASTRTKAKQVATDAGDHERTPQQGLPPKPPIPLPARPPPAFPARRPAPARGFRITDSIPFGNNLGPGIYQSAPAPETGSMGPLPLHYPGPNQQFQPPQTVDPRLLFSQQMVQQQSYQHPVGAVPSPLTYPAHQMDPQHQHPLPDQAQPQFEMDEAFMEAFMSMEGDNFTYSTL